MEYTIEDVERWEKKQKKKAKRADTGFTGTNQFFKNINLFKIL